MEQKLQLDKRVSFIAAAGTVLDPTTPSRSTQQWASTPTTIEVSSPVQVAEQQTQQLALQEEALELAKQKEERMEQRYSEKVPFP